MPTTKTSPDYRPGAAGTPARQASGADAGAGLSRGETLDYVKTMLAELSALARGQKLDMLAYLLEMAHLEAVDALAREPERRPTTSPPRRISRNGARDPSDQ